MTNRRSLVRWAAALAAGMLLAVQAAAPCTLALISGRATANGRPLMWKNRDTSGPNNKLAYFKGPKYDFIAVAISEEASPAEMATAMKTYFGPLK